MSAEELLAPGLLAIIAGQLGFGFRSLKKLIVDQGRRLSRLECLHLRHKPEDFDHLKIGGTD